MALRLFVTGSLLPSRSMTTLWLNALLIAESGTLYALSVIAMLATFLSGSNVQCPMIDAIVLLVVSREKHLWRSFPAADPRICTRAF